MSKLQIITELAADTAREIARGSPYKIGRAHV